MPVEWNAEDVMRKIRAATMKGVIKGTEIVSEDGSRRILEGPKSGRVYVRRGVSHTASAPGEAPASDTGRLAQSRKTFFDHDNLLGKARWSTEYARALELGSTYQIDLDAGALRPDQLELGTQTIEPRPFARPSLYENRSRIEEAIAHEIRSVLA